MASKKNISVSTAKVGMNKDSHLANLRPEEYTHAKNSNFWSEDGNTFNIQNEPSNLLATRYKEGFSVIGLKSDRNSDSVYFFLVNSETNVSEIGVIKNINNLPDLSDDILECKECEYKVKLTEPLNEQQQFETQEYTTLLNDECNNCLNFNKDFPIKSVEIKNEKCGKVMYFTDNYNSPRYIELDNLDKYSYKGEELCGDDSNVEETCVACDKMKIFKEAKILNVQPSQIVLGGNLKRGTYEFLAAYSDENGNEVSRYFSITNPIPIFDENNNILEQENLADETSFAIKLDVSNIDLSYTHYKVAVIQRTDINAATSYFIEGIHSTSDNEIIYTTDQDKQRTTLSNLNKPSVRVDKWKSLTAANGYIFGSGITRPKQMNLQPVINLLSPFLNWQSFIAKEDLYDQGVAASKYRGYYRDETYPLGIRFLLDGEYSPVYHFIGRPLKQGEDTIVTNNDSESISKLSDSCIDTTIDKKWQIYNTASELGSCALDENISTNTITEEIQKICFLEYVDELDNGGFSIPLSEGETYIDLETYIDENRDYLISISNDPNCSTTNSQGLCDLAELINPANYPNDNCTPNFENNCSENQNPVAEEMFLSEEIEGEQTTKIEDTFPDEYSLLPPPENCTIHVVDFNEGGKLRDEDFIDKYGSFDVFGNYRAKFFVRDFSFINEKCNYATEITNFSYVTNYRPGYFHNYYGADTLPELQELNKNSLAVEGDAAGLAGLFSDKIHKGALWYKKEITESRFLIDITAQTNPTESDEISDFRPYLQGNNSSNTKNTRVRINIFDNCSSVNPFHSEVLDLEDGIEYLCDYNETTSNLSITKTDGQVIVEQINSQTFYIAIDVPIAETQGYTNEEDDSDGFTTRYKTFPTKGCFSILSKEIQYKRVDVTFENITVGKKQTYVASCDIEVPILEDCEAYPHKFGEFAYVESTEEYPDNKDLYDSSLLDISPSDIPNDTYYDQEGSPITYREHFKNTFNLNESGSKYELTEDLDFRCKPIRHFKFPDNKVSTFMYENQMSSFSESIIYPLGVTINEELINSFLDIAVKNNLITQSQRDKIQGYEIVRGDRTANESIKSKGLVYDMYSYKEGAKDIHYANYPFNSLGADRLNYLDEARERFIPHPYDSQSNHMWSFTSPETHKDNIQLPSFMKVDGYMYGRAKIQFNEMRDHSEWVILGSKLKRLASTLATIEVGSEALINVAEMTSRQWFFAGPAGGGSGLGLVAAGIVAVTEAISSVIFKYARYKYEWLETFRNLGSPRNFAYYSTGVGYMNYFKPNNSEEDNIRYLNVKKNLKGSRLIVTDSVGGEQININHTDREKTVLLSTGKESPIVYNSEYTSYDNADIDFNSTSRTFASENNACTKGLSEEILRNAASMYVSLKDYLPSQYGTIGSVKWLTTGYRGDLSDPKTNCIGIFGGDVFITRNTILRRMPLFLTTAMNQANLLPFEYKFYSNIGKEPRFYADYAINTEDSSAGRPLPDVDSDFNFDCYSGSSGNYVKEPSKFYLDYNGISSYLVESTINTSNRYAKKEPWNNFYPNTGDYMEWTQRAVVDIRREIPFLYNNVYSKNVTPTGIFSLPVNYNKEEYDCKTDSPNGTMYSLPDNSENAYLDPWLIYRPLDSYEFPTEYGNLIELRGIETAQVLGRFEDETVIFNAVDTLTDDGQSPDAQVLGTGGIFARRPRTFASTDLGYAGSQTQQMISCEYGHFFVDAERGQVFKIPNGGQGIEEISAYSNKQPSGMRQWFKKQLPFKIKKYFPDFDIDNPYTSAGITMGWDSMFRRLFITKKDYTLINDDNYCIRDGKLRSTLIDQEVIEEYQQQGYTFEGIVDCQLKFTSESIPQSTDIYAIFDTTSMNISDGEVASQALNEWFLQYKLDNPSYQGNLYIIPLGVERWVVYPRFLYFGAIPPTGGVWTSIQQLPPNFNTNSWQPPTNIVVIAFVDESSDYHSNSLLDGFLGQPTSSYMTDYNLAKNDNFYNYFQGIVYPIPKDTEGETASLVLQALASIEGTTLTQQQIDETGTTIDVSLLLTENPYQGLTPLKELGWKGVYDKTSPAEEVFTSENFGNELTGIINEEETQSKEIYVDLPEISVMNEEYFKEVSWTIAYSVDTGKWMSYYDFKPNFYIAQNGYFQTGVNKEGDEKGLWSHLLTNKSYGVFYGKAYDWEIEIPSTNQGDAKSMESFTYNLDVRRYRNDYDFYQNKKLGFEKAVIWNQSNNSGQLQLDLQQTIRQISKYPKTNGNTQSILQTTQDGEFRFNYFYNRVKDADNMLHLWEWDENQIDKTLNQQALSFKGKRVLERLRGNMFLVNLKSSETLHKKIFTIAKTKETIYDK